MNTGSWIPDDVGLTSPADKLAFYQRELAPGKMKAGRGSLKDHNKDGSVDWKDLTFHQERIYKITDTDRDGVADKITVFAEGFNSPVSGIAAGVLYFDGWVYVTAIPDVWRLKDTDGDGVADVKEIVATGFGGHIAYAGHDMHGLRLGPDGRIYWTVGDKGANVVSKEGRRFAYPHEGCVLRCEPDGSGFEVFAHGIRNTQEIAFDSFGNVIGVDNDGDQPKERERLMYLLEGSDTGWRNQHQYQTTESRWMKENMWMPAGAADQPLSITPPIANYSDGPAGFLFEPGHALDGDLRGHFILDQFPKGKMDAFTLVPDRDTSVRKPCASSTTGSWASACPGLRMVAPTSPTGSAATRSTARAPSGAWTSPLTSTRPPRPSFRNLSPWRSRRMSCSDCSLTATSASASTPRSASIASEPGRRCWRSP